MPTIIWSKSKGKDKLDPSMKKKAYAFFEKLQEDDALPGLNIEEIEDSRDRRVRTGRVDNNFRAVLFKLKQIDDAVYVAHGIWPHDEANSLSQTRCPDMPRVQRRARNYADNGWLLLPRMPA